jgi:hypothetical protein
MTVLSQIAGGLASRASRSAKRRASPMRSSARSDAFVQRTGRGSDHRAARHLHQPWPAHRHGRRHLDSARAGRHLPCHEPAQCRPAQGLARRPGAGARPAGRRCDHRRRNDVGKMEQGWERTRAASFAYTSTAGPMLSGTLVTVAGFIPIALAKSATGEYAFAFFQINAIAAAHLLAGGSRRHSLAGLQAAAQPACTTQPGPYRTPPASTGRRLERLGLAGPATAKTTTFMARLSTPASANWSAGACTRRWLVIGTTLIALRTAIVGMGKVQKQFFPNSTRLELNVELRLPEGASVKATMPKPNWRNGWTRTRPNSTSSSITSPTSAPARRAITWASTSNCPPATSASSSS